MNHLFVNPNTGVIKAGWRIVIFLTIFFVLNIGLMTGVRAILGSLPATGVIWFLLLGISATLATYITTKYIIKRPLKSIGLSKNYAVKDLIAGIFISAFIMSMMYILLMSFGYLKYEGLCWWQEKEHTLGVLKSTGILAMIIVFFKFTVVAWWEELVFRGIILQNISQGLSIKWGVILSTLGFGLVHAGNPNATILSTVLIMIITFKLVYAYFKSGQLWMPIGLHLGWNFFQASIFGFASSGHISPSLIAQAPIGPDWLSGGSFGAENSILIAPITIASLFLIHLHVKYSRGINGLNFSEFLLKESDFITPSKTVKDVKII